MTIPPNPHPEQVEAAREILAQSLDKHGFPWAARDTREGATRLGPAVIAAMIEFASLANRPADDVAAKRDAEELEAIGKAPWQGEQPIEEEARYWKGRPWVPLEAAISELQFWQKRDYLHALRVPLSPEANRPADDGEVSADYRRDIGKAFEVVRAGARRLHVLGWERSGSDLGRAVEAIESALSCLPMRVLRDRFADDEAAKALYDTWSDQPGWVPWGERGNSTMQERARREVML